MVDIRVTYVIGTYQQRLNSKQYVPFTTFGRATLGANGFANKLFLAFLFSNPEVGIQLLKAVGLIWSRIVCCKCGFQMSWCVDTNRKVGFRWRCRRITSPSACSASMTIRHDSRFQQSNLNFIEVLFLTYIVRSYGHDREHVAACESLPVPTTWSGNYIYQLAHILAAGRRSDNVEQFTKFNGIVASLDWSATPPHHHCYVTT